MNAVQNRLTKNRIGLTLIELVLVLVILTVLATVAVRMLEPQMDQKRFEATQRTLENIGDAIVGPNNARSADGNVLVSGFIADVGRGPVSLNELVNAPVSIAVDPMAVAMFQTASPAGDSEVTIHGGWNGPYIQLPIGASQFTDAWATPFDLYDLTGTPATGIEEIGIIRSRGRDALAATGTGYDADLSLVLSADSTAVSQGLITTSQIQDQLRQPVTVQIYFQDTSQNPDPANGTSLIVRIYGPYRTTNGEFKLGTIEEQQLTVDGSPQSATFTLPIGPRVIRAYQVTSVPADKEDDLSATTIKSTPIRFTVSRQSSSLQLILR